MQFSVSETTHGPVPELTIRQLSGLSTAALVLLYSITNPPFMLNWWTPDWLRVTIELIVVIPVFAKEITNVRKSTFLFILVLVTIIKIPTETSAIRTLLQHIEKAGFALLLLNSISRNRGVIRTLHIGLEIVFLFSAFQVIAAAIVWYVQPSLFVFDFLNLSSKANYGYSGNLLLGYLVHRGLGFATFPRPTAYIFEPGILAGLLLFYNFVPSPLKLTRRMATVRHLFFVVAAILTGSFTTVFLLAGLGILRISKRKWVGVVILFASAIVLWAIADRFFGLLPSGGNRLGRAQDAVNVILHSSILQFLIGREPDTTGSSFGAVNAGVALLIINYGVVFAFMMTRFFRHFIRSVDIYFMVIAMNLAFDFFWWPIFWLILALISWADVAIATKEIGTDANQR